MKTVETPAAKKATALRGKLVRVMTPEERSADMEAFGKEIRRTKASAIAFLKEAGFLDDNGQLAEPYRS